MESYFRSHPATGALIVVNIVAFIALEALGLLQGYALYNAGVLTPYALLDGRWYTLLTSMFMHGGILHLACNMVTLYYVGTIIESVFGRVRYLVIYFFAGLCGGLASMAVMIAQGNLNYGVVGASGAIFGLFAAYGYLLAREYRSPAVLMQSPSLDDLKGVAGLLIANILIGLTPGIAMEAHLGGLIGGAVASIPLYELLRRSIQRGIDAGIEPPSVVTPQPERYDFDAAQAAHEAAMAARQEYVDAWNATKPSQRAQLERSVSSLPMDKQNDEQNHN